MRSAQPLKLRWAFKWLRGCRAYDPQRRRTRLPGPISVDLQTIDRCNAACVMCPYPSQDHSGPARRMDDALYTRILHELRDIGTVRTICLMLQNEPLLDRRLHERAREARELFGSSLELVVVTNGELLTEDRLDELQRAGVSRIAVSIDAAREQTFHKIRKGLDFAKVLANTEALLERRGALDALVKFLVQRDNEGEGQEFLRYWRTRGAAVSIDRLCNRAGLLDDYERLWAPRHGLVRRLAERVLDRLIPVCPLPFSSSYILADGRVICCSHDWGPRAVVGDLSQQPFAEIWNGQAINQYRHLLWSHRTQDSLLCRDCSMAEAFWEW
jgi:radical SAM protein with 4Fe4S-binding SPASM domain